MSKIPSQSINENIFSNCSVDDNILILDSLDENYFSDSKMTKWKTQYFKIDRTKEVITQKKISGLFDSHDISQEKFDKIVLKNFIEFTDDPFHILNFLEKSLTSNGMFVIVFPNVSFFKERIKFLNGDFLDFAQISDRKLQYYFSISTILQFFLYLEYSIENIFRFEKNIKIADYSDLNEFTISDELLDSITRDSESTVSNYIFLVKPSSIKNSDMQKWIFEFPKNMTTDRLKEWFDYYKHHLPNTTSNSQHEQKIKDQNQSIEELKTRINSIENSFTWKFLRKLDKFKQFQNKF